MLWQVRFLPFPLMKKSITYLSFILGGLVIAFGTFFAQSAHATIIASMTQTGSAPCGEWMCYQQLGTGLTGTARTIYIKLNQSFGHNDSDDEIWNLLEYNSGAYTGAQIVATTTVQDHTTDTDLTQTFDTAYVLDNTKYYAFVMRGGQSNTGHYYDIEGAAPGDYPDGTAYYCTDNGNYSDPYQHDSNFTTDTNCHTPTRQVYFILTDDQSNGGDENIIWSNPPLDATTTLNNNFTASATISHLTANQIYSVFFVAELQATGTGPSAWPAGSQFVKSAGLASLSSSTYVQLPMKLENGTYSFAAAIFDGVVIDPNFQGYLDRSVTNGIVDDSPNFVTAPPENTFTHESVFSGVTSTPQIDCSAWNWTETYLGTIPFFSQDFGQRASCEIKNFVNDLVVETKIYIGGAFIQIVSLFTNVFPINIIAGLNEDIDAAASAAATSSPIVLEGSGTFGGRSITLLTSTTTDWIADNASYDYKELLDKVLYLITFCVILLECVYAIKLFKRI